MLAGLTGALALAPALAADSFLSPARGEVLTPGQVVEARWDVSCSAAPPSADEAELVLSLDGGSVFAIRVSRELSACQERLRWTVPALPTEKGRLALRRGVEGREESETLSVMSETFVILPDPEGRLEDLHPGRGESWVEQDFAFEEAEDFLRGSICAAGNLVARDPYAPDAESGEVSGLVAPASRPRTFRDSAAVARNLELGAARSPRPVPTTLRL